MGYVQIELTGSSPLVCHNIQLNDPDNHFKKEIAVLTSKVKKTEDDRRAIERLEWYGGLYTDPDIPGPVVPSGNIRKTLINAGKITKKGTQIARALSFTDLHVPIVFDGPKDLDVLFANTTYHYRTSVGIGQKRVMRMRPQFPRWVVMAKAYLIDSVMDLEDLRLVIETAGLAEGMGDNRINGWGRFTGTVKAL